MIYQLYKKQVEAWKERFPDLMVRSDLNVSPEEVDSVLSSRHKDTIELLEAEIERKRGMRKDAEYGMDVEAFKGTVAARSHNRSYNSAIEEDIAYLEEQIKLIKKEI